MFEGWNEFFLLLGGAAAALIGLLFVVTTLAAGMKLGRESLAQGEAYYMTPTLFHYVTVLVLSALGTAPDVSGTVIGWVAGAWAVVGFIYCAAMAVLVRTRRLPDSGHWADVFGYGILPALMYLGLLAASWSAANGNPHAPHATAIALVVLLVLGIRNAWDLITFIAPRSAGKDEVSTEVARNR